MERQRKEDEERRKLEAEERERRKIEEAELLKQKEEKAKREKIEEEEKAKWDKKKGCLEEVGCFTIGIVLVWLFGFLVSNAINPAVAALIVIVLAVGSSFVVSHLSGDS